MRSQFEKGLGLHRGPLVTSSVSATCGWCQVTPTAEVGLGSMGHVNGDLLEVVSFCFLSLEVHGTEGPLGQGLGRVSVGRWRPLAHCFSVLFSSLISDKMFPALGFGAQLPPDWKVSEAGLFPLG